MTTRQTNCVLRLVGSMAVTERRQPDCLQRLSAVKSEPSAVQQRLRAGWIHRHRDVKILLCSLRHGWLGLRAM